ncbi:unnamed protein product [Cyclocybe aegerita]|uniref:Uncharacterized protein n=1 Tax=Cyclocybe aegerita TaxID=1973307 RepID=A0A8S0WLA1_CYCAE|nr:unnamed protein product [Cyclocybe aegerita]
MPKVPSSPQSRRVRFDLPLSRENTIYSESSTSSRRPADPTPDEQDLQDEDLIKHLLLDSVSSSQSTEETDEVPFVLYNVPGPIGLQFLYNTLDSLNLLSYGTPSPPAPTPPPKPPHSARPKPYTKKRLYPVTKDRYTHRTPRRTTTSFYHTEAYFADAESEYIIPPGADDESPVRIRVTGDWSKERLGKQKGDELVIYRVPQNDVVFFGISSAGYGLKGHSIRQPRDGDAVTVVRHGHVSWDMGNKGEKWFLMGRDESVISDLVIRARVTRPSLFTRVKRALWEEPKRYLAANPILPNPFA